MNAAAAPGPGACDCHMHVYEDAYPLAPSATFKPPHAPVAAYRAVQRELGLERTVVAQPTGYGLDNRCTLAALAELGSQARAIVVVAADVADAELERMHGAGVRGVRFMMLPGGVLPWSALEPTAARIAALGWHIDLQLDGRELAQHEAMLQRLPCRLVIDHVGRFLGPVTAESDSVRTLLRLLDAGGSWIKISAPYESSRSGPPGYDDIAWIARLVAARHPERCLWASNWPHPNRHPPPSNASMLDWAFGCVDDASMQRRMLVDNPAELYGFLS
jgi:D-galactarolactone isomerase